MSDHPAGKPRPGMLTWVLWGAALLGVAAVLYIMAKASTKPEPTKIATEVPAGAGAPQKTVLEKLEKPQAPTPAPAYAFKDAGGKSLKVADLKGKVVVMNVWATWCGPCKVEMPTLAALQASYAGKPVEVVTISIDKDDDVEKARAFIAQHQPLKFYSDPEAKLPWELTPPAAGMPTTVIYGKDGMERGRVAGDANWAGPEAKSVIDRVLAEG